MKRFLALILAMVIVLSLAACAGNSGNQPAASGSGSETQSAAGSNTASAPQKTMKLGGIFAADTAGGIAALEFCDLVEKYTNGEIHVDYYPSEQLGTEQEMVESVNMGALDFTFPSASVCGLFSKELLIFPLPFVVDDWDHLDRIMKGDIGDELLSGIESSTDLKVVAANWYREPRYLYANKPVKTLDDLKGVRIRVPENVTYVKGWGRLGASPTPMALSEVYTAIQTGALDAAETTIGTYMTQGTYAVAPYLMMTEHVYESNLLLTNKNLFDGLTESQQEAIMKAGEEAGVKHQEAVKSILEDELKFLQDNGVTVVDVDREDWVARMDGLADEIWDVWGNETLYGRMRALA